MAVTTPMSVGAGPNNTGERLDNPPPASPDQGKRAKHGSLVENQLKRQGAPGTGLGIDGGDPQVLALQGTEMIEMGAQKVSAALPALAQALQTLVANLKVVIPQAISDQLAGISNSGAGGPASGVAPAPPPPGPPPMTSVGPGGGGVPPGAAPPGPGGPAVGPPAGSFGSL